MHFVGIDPSLSGTGIVCLNENDSIFDQSLVKTDSKSEMEDRILFIVSELNKYIKYHPLVYLEGLSFGSFGNARLQLAGLHFYLRIFLRTNGISYKIISPKTLKKFATGNGNSKGKKIIIKSIEQKWGIRWKDHNLADAYVLAKMALEDYNG